MDSVAMNGGDGPDSYTKNSKFQGNALDLAKVLLSNSIRHKLIIGEDNAKKLFTVADLGCSVGPNTFSCVNTMIEAVKSTIESKTSLGDDEMPEFQVFFNDHVTNDFNTLFKALPSDRQYMAAGVPGSFYGRLFPEASMDLMHTSFSLNWLKQVPERVLERDSPAWNKGSISYVRSSDLVVEAYTEQFLGDLKAFLGPRSVEMAQNGLLAIIMACRPDGTMPSESKIMQMMEFCLGDVLSDTAKEVGKVSEALVDLFNLPTFYPNASEVEQVVSSFENLRVEKMEEMFLLQKMETLDDARSSARSLRATMEGVLCKHFGAELITDELFERYAQKRLDFSKTVYSDGIEKTGFLFVLVQRT